MRTRKCGRSTTPRTHRQPAGKVFPSAYGEMEEWELKAHDASDREALNKVHSILGPDVLQPFDTYYELLFLRLKHREGDRLAVLKCVSLCNKRRAVLPRWALETLAQRFDRYLGSKTLKLDNALFGTVKGGRHADPRSEASDRADALNVYAALEGARLAGLKGDNALDCARQALAEVGEHGKHVQPETIKAYHTRKRPRRSEFHSNLSLFFAQVISRKLGAP